MELITAIEILDYHQKWRLGEREDMIFESIKITEALNIVLAYVKGDMNKTNDDVKIVDLGISRRAKNCLRHNNIYTLRELSSISERRCGSFRGLGLSTMQELTDELFKNGLKWANER